MNVEPIGTKQTNNKYTMLTILFIAAVIAFFLLVKFDFSFKVENKNSAKPLIDFRLTNDTSKMLSKEESETKTEVKK